MAAETMPVEDQPHGTPPSPEPAAGSAVQESHHHRRWHRRAFLRLLPADERHPDRDSGGEFAAGRIMHGVASRAVCF